MPRRSKSQKLAVTRKWRQGWSPEYRAKRVKQTAEWRAKNLNTELVNYLYWRFLFLARKDRINEQRRARKKQLSQRRTAIGLLTFTPFLKETS